MIRTFLEAVGLAGPEPPFAAQAPLFGARPRDPRFERRAHAYLVGKKCLGCGGTVKLQVHHYYPWHLYPELEMAEEYWRPLCMAPNKLCHLLLGHRGDFRRFVPDLDGLLRQLSLVDANVTTQRIPGIPK